MLFPAGTVSLARDLAILLLPLALAWDNAVAPRPPLAWSSWYALTTGLNCSEHNALSEEAILETAAGLRRFGFQQAGFSTLILDDCWQNASRSTDGTLHADPARFPRGLAWLGAELRRQGFELGLYTTPGAYSCMKRPASLGHVQQDVDLWVRSFGIRYLKYCVCNTTHALRQTAYAEMQRVLANTSQPVVLEIDPFMERPFTTWPQLGHVVGAHPDVGDRWEAWTKAVEDLYAWGTYGAPLRGHWPLVDILQTGGAQTAEEDKAQVSVYVVLCSPLLLGVDMRDSARLSRVAPLLTHKRLLELRCDASEPGPVPAPRRSGAAWWRPLRDGSVLAALVSDAAGTRNVSWGDLALPLGPHIVEDVWSAETRLMQELSLSVPQRGARLVVVHPTSLVFVA
mmetsp:Transcript_89483/g.266920  ORF Transcript_89483/g.266920 Transcript_89483/m.266920 type:complete len:398 (-) Transcript_89483:143-1336(-)